MKKGKEKSSTASSFPFLFSNARTHSGVTLFGCLLFLALFIATQRYNWLTALSLWITIFILSLISCPRPLKLVVRMAGILPFLCLALLLHAFFTPGAILWSVGGFYLTKDGLIEGAWISQTLGFFFYISFVITAGTSSFFLFRVLERLSRLSFLRLLNLRLGILVLFLILRWLRILPISWKRQVTEAMRGEPERLNKLIKGLRQIPLIFLKEITRTRQWSQLFIARGYAEGVLILSESPFTPLRLKDIAVLIGIFIATAFWFLRRF